MYKREYLLPIIAGGVLAAVLALSIVFFLRYDSQWHRYVLFFPKYTDPGIVEGEVRGVRMHNDREKNLERFIHELMLGPGDVRYLPVMPEDGNVNTLILRDNELYVDFSHSILFSNDEVPFPLEERFELMTKSIRWNFPDIKTINYSINGEVPVDLMAYLTENREVEKKK